MKATVEKIIFQKIVISYGRIGQVILLYCYELLPLFNFLDYTKDS
jgi:hypothetical protein